MIAHKYKMKGFGLKQLENQASMKTRSAFKIGLSHLANTRACMKMRMTPGGAGIIVRAPDDLALLPFKQRICFRKGPSKLILKEGFDVPVIDAVVASFKVLFDFGIGSLDELFQLFFRHAIFFFGIIGRFDFHGTE